MLTNQTRKRDRNGTYYHDPCPLDRMAHEGGGNGALDAGLAIRELPRKYNLVYEMGERGGKFDPLSNGEDGGNENRDGDNSDSDDDGGGEGDGGDTREQTRQSIWKGSLQRSATAPGSKKHVSANQKHCANASLLKSTTLLWGGGPTVSEKAASRKQAKIQRQKPSHKGSAENKRRSSRIVRGSSASVAVASPKAGQLRPSTQKQKQNRIPNTMGLNRTAKPSSSLSEPSAKVPPSRYQAPFGTAPSSFTSYSSSATSMDELPDELLLHVFALGTKQDLAALACSCSRFRRIVYDERLWIKVDAQGLALDADRLAFFGSRRPRHLDLSRCSGVDKVGLELLAEACGDVLQSLTLVGCKQTTNESLIPIAASCEALSELDISWVRQK